MKKLFILSIIISAVMSMPLHAMTSEQANTQSALAMVLRESLAKKRYATASKLINTRRVRVSSEARAFLTPDAIKGLSQAALQQKDINTLKFIMGDHLFSDVELVHEALELHDPRAIDLLLELGVKVPHEQWQTFFDAYTGLNRLWAQPAEEYEAYRDQVNPQKLTALLASKAKKFINLNKINANGSTALHVAASRLFSYGEGSLEPESPVRIEELANIKDRENAKILIKAGADVNMGNPLASAEQFYAEDIIELLKQHGAK